MNRNVPSCQHSGREEGVQRGEAPEQGGFRDLG